MPHNADTNANEMSSSPADYVLNIEINIMHETLHYIQQQDHFCRRILYQLQTFRLKSDNSYLIEIYLFIMNVTDN